MKILGLLNLHHSPELGPLTERRSIASTSFLGRYAFMDFMLSNFSNSGIDCVAILVHQQPRSILKHLGSRNTFNVNTKTGFELIAYNELGVKRGGKYNNDISNIRVNEWIVKQGDPDIVVIAPAHYVYPIDFNPVIEQHVKNNAEITMIYTDVEDAKNHFIDSDVLALNPDETVKHISLNKGASLHAHISLETIVINRKKFDSLILEAKQISPFFTLYDIILHKINHGQRVNTYKYSGYVRCFNSLENYVKYSMELLNYKVREQLFLPNWPFYTVTNDTPPAKYCEGADVKHSFVANGCNIKGKVVNSILSRNVIVEKGCEISDSIIFTDTFIDANTTIKYAIADKQVSVKIVKELVGDENNFVYIRQGDEV